MQVDESGHFVVFIAPSKFCNPSSDPQVLSSGKKNN